MGKLVKSRSFGKNLKVNIYQFNEYGKRVYRIYALRRVSLGSNKWRESQATSSPQSKQEALKELAEYRDASWVTLLHPVLRDSGTSMSAGYNYQLGKSKPRQSSMLGGLP